MRFVFQAKGNRDLGSVNLPGLCASLAALIYSIQLLIDDSASCRWFSFQEGCTATPGFQVFLWIATICTFIVFLFTARGVLFGIFLAIRSGIRLIPAYDSLKILYSAFNKMRDELRFYPNRSPDSFLEEISKSSADESRMFLAQDLGLLKNQTISHHKWPDSGGPMRDLINGHLKHGHWSEEYHSSIEKLQVIKRASSLYSELIQFYVSSVQPSIQFCANEVVEDFEGQNLVTIEDGMPTGPEAVQFAYDQAKAAQNMRTVLLVAPMSAFITFDHKENDPMISDVFRPIACLVKERQDILLLQVNSNNSLRKPTLFVYNNSTAEELLSRIDDSLICPSGVFNVSFVNDFSEYKEILNGRISENGKRMLEGDAIIVWPPLTEYYQGKIIGEAFLTLANPQVLSANRESRIWLYGQKSMFDAPEKHELAWQFVKCLCQKMLAEEEIGHSFLGACLGFNKLGQFLRGYRTRALAVVK